MTSRYEDALLYVDQMARADELAVTAGVPSLDLMEAAGRAVANRVRRQWRRRPVVILCGPGNNGGDGYVAARYLKEAGWPVSVMSLTGIEQLKGDAKVNAAKWTGETLAADPSALNDGIIVVDALFGAGLTRPLDGVALDLVNAINTRQLQCLAVDVPSGLDGDSGEVRGAAPTASCTVTFFRLKPGHLLEPGKSLCGDLIVADIGTPMGVLDEIAPRIFGNSPRLWRGSLPVPQAGDHKYSRGHVAVVGGAEMTGAARLTARGARRIGAGMVSIICPATAQQVYRAGDPGQLIFTAESSSELSDLLNRKRRSAVVVGPGNGSTSSTRSNTIAALRSGLPTVVDADALTVFEDDPAALFGWISGPTVLTPHDGEFARLFDVQGSKLPRALSAAEISNAVIVLKGGDTVIASPDGQAIINTNASSYLATAGSGDVLAGIIAGLMGQGVEPFLAAAAGVWLHGEAASRFGPGLIAEDIPEALPQVLSEIDD